MGLGVLVCVDEVFRGKCGEFHAFRVFLFARVFEDIVAEEFSFNVFICGEVEVVRVFGEFFDEVEVFFCERA